MAGPATDPTPHPEAIDRLVAARDTFVAFVRRRTGDEDLAAEVVQEALSRAVAAIDGLRDEQRVVPWFWQIVRNAMSDALERRRRLEPLPADLDAGATPSAELCACLRSVLDGLPERQRAAFQLIEFDGVDPGSAAAQLGISVGNLKVIRHRGRMALRDRLEAVCRSCAGRACRDCDCPPAPGRAER